MNALQTAILRVLTGKDRFHAKETNNSGAIRCFCFLRFPTWLARGKPIASRVLVFLRAIGIFNAAIWLGTGVFFTFGVAPGIFSDAMKEVFVPKDSPLGDYYLGIIAQQLIERYFTVNLVCCLVALAHFFGEMIYAGKPFRRLTFSLLIGILAIALLTTYVFAPKIKAVHYAKYRGAPDQRPAARQQMSRLHAISASGNLLSLIALVIYTWQVSNPSDPTRFVGATSKFRG